MFNKRLIGIYIGQFAISATFWFFLTWFPTYLVEARGIDFFKSGLLSSVPYLAAFCGVLLAGKISDKLIVKGMSVSLASGGNFAPALIFITALALIGACSYIFVVGKIDIEN